MKTFLFFLSVLITCCNCFAQTTNIERTKEIAQLEKANYNAANNKTASLASNNFQVTYYRCDWNIDPAVRYISGSVTSYFKTTAFTNQIVYDFTNKLTVDSVIYHNQHAIFSQQSNSTLIINFSVEFGIGKQDSVAVYYH
ncbi:MAG: hypothetical protein JO072_10540, partial [Parafilimonas sp.]|nr:hypothetical protein [Parafilimonas sp.]